MYQYALGLERGAEKRASPMKSKLTAEAIWKGVQHIYMCRAQTCVMRLRGAL